MSEAIIPFSIVIPLYNKEGTVERAIRSILHQTVQVFEIIVVNDGSTDDGPAFVESIGDPRIRLIHQTNQGVSAARNCGITEAKHELIAFLDADDEWLPEFLETIRQMVFHYPHCSLYATRYYLRSSKGEQKPAIVRGLTNEFEGVLEDYFQIAARSNPPVWSSAACAKKSALMQIGGFPIGVKSGEDLLTWAKMASHFSVAYSMSCLSIFYQTPAETCESVPSRIPADDDVVGRSLAELLNIVEADKRFSLRLYCALWHKMRASCYLRLDMKKKARLEIYRAFRHTISLKLAVYWALSFSPGFMIRSTFRMGTSNR